MRRTAINFDPMTSRSTLDPIWYLWVPALFMVFQIILEVTLPRDVLAAVHSEWGPHETLQFAVISAAFLVAFTSLMRIDWKTQKYLGIWFAVASICCLFVSGEEVSWGQHVFEWESSEFWHAVNDQGETNLHNTSSWFDQKPRLLLYVGIICGGIVFPWLRKYKPGLLPARFDIIYPSSRLLLVSLLVVIPHMVEKFGDLVGFPMFVRVSEVQELYMFYFVLLYLWDLRQREISKA